jgi:hypothetical protein
VSGAPLLVHVTVSGAPLVVQARVSGAPLVVQVRVSGAPQMLRVFQCFSAKCCTEIINYACKTTCSVF